MTNNCILLQRAKVGGSTVINLAGLANSISSTYNNPGFGHEGLHFHSLQDGTQQFFWMVQEANVAEVGAYWGDEYIRGVCKWDLTGIAPATEAKLCFDIFDATNYSSVDEPVGGLYGQVPLCDPNVYPHDPPVPYNGTLRLMWMQPSNMQDDELDFNRPATSVQDFVAANIAYPNTFEIDLTASFNANTGGLFAIRIEDTHDPLEVWPGPPTLDPLLYPPPVDRLVGFEGGVFDALDGRDGRGAITFTNFRIKASY